MQRINTTNKAPDLFGAGKDGYRAGNPATGQHATELSFNAMNALQEEIAYVIEASGSVLNTADNTQLKTAIQMLGDVRYARLAGLANQLFSVAPAAAVDHAVNLGQFAKSLTVSGYQKLPGGLILQWGNIPVAPATPTYTTFPISFPNACFSIIANNSQNNAQIANAWNPTLAGFWYQGYTGTLALNWLSIGY